jgi:hypothetical protein
MLGKRRTSPHCHDDAATRPEDDEEGLDAEAVDVGVDEVPDPHHSGCLLDGVQAAVAADGACEGATGQGDHGVDLLAEELDEEHPEQDELRAGLVAGALGLGEGVGHEGEEEREAGPEEDARDGGVAAVAAQEGDAEEGHEHRGGDHEPLGARVGGHGEVLHQRGRRGDAHRADIDRGGGVTARTGVVYWPPAVHLDDADDTGACVCCIYSTSFGLACDIKFCRGRERHTARIDAGVRSLAPSISLYI